MIKENGGGFVLRHLISQILGRYCYTVTPLDLIQVSPVCSRNNNSKREEKHRSAAREDVVLGDI